MELAVDEAGPGATAAYTVRLGERPRSRFTYLSVTPVSGDPGAATLTTHPFQDGILRFSGSNWKWSTRSR